MKAPNLKFPHLVVFASIFFSPFVFAAQMFEIERNDPIPVAQFVVPGMSGFELSAALGNVSGPAVEDLDFYSFYGQAGDVVTFDIDGGYGGLRSVDTVMAVFGDAPDYRMLRMNDDNYPADPGSISSLDSRIENFVLPVTGTYYVGVSHFPRYFQNGGTARSASPQNGDYQLVITGVSDPTLHITISVKPGHNELAPLNPRARGSIPVALLSSEDFTPAKVDTKSLTFGHDGNEESLVRCNKAVADLNKDGKADLICHFDNQTAGFHHGDLEGVLQGSLIDGTKIEGRGLLKVVPEKADH